MSSPIIGCAASSHCTAVTCSDATLHCLSANEGSRVLPPIKLQGPAVIVKVQDRFLGVVTAHGIINIWDVVKKKSTLKTSILNLIDSGSQNHIS